MAELKTRPTGTSVTAFIDSLDDPQARKDCKALVKVMRRATGAGPRMWGSGMIGFGEYHYKYASGREGDWFLAGFSPRKGKLSLYVNPCGDRHAALLKKLGRIKTGKGCIYIKKVEDIDLAVLEKLVVESVRHLAKSSG